MNKKKGMTLIESLIALVVTTGISMTMVKAYTEKTKQENYESYASDLNNILKAVDQRIAVDGYDYDKWSTVSWSDSDILDLIKKDLQGINSVCGEGTWVPSYGDDDLKLVSCDLLQKNPYNTKISADLTTDSNGFVNTFKIKYKFDSDDSFLKDFTNVKNILRKAKSMITANLSGSVYYETVNDTTGVNISFKECIDLESDCAFVATLNNIGESDSVKTDGSNSMFASHLSFVPTKGSSSPLKCIKWENSEDDGTGIWTRKDVEDCGVGIYENNNSAVMVDVAATNGTFKNILLENECFVYKWDAGDVALTTEKSPCGMTKDGTEIYQVVDNTIANTTTTRSLSAGAIRSKVAVIEDLTVSVAKIDSIISPLINVNTLNVLNALNVTGLSTFTKDVKMNENLDIVGTVSANSGSITTLLSDDATLENIDNTNLITQKIDIKDQLILSKINNAGSGCSPNGSLSRTSTGVLLSCVSGVWSSNESVIKSFSGTSSISGLTGGKKYLVSVYGITANRGTKNHTLNGVRVYNSSGGIIAATPSRYVNWADGSSAQSATLLVTAPSNGYIRGLTDAGNALTMVAIQLN